MEFHKLNSLVSNQGKTIKYMHKKAFEKKQNQIMYSTNFKQYLNLNDFKAVKFTCRLSL